MAALLRRRRTTVSVVVSVTDSNAPFLADCLASLGEQEHPPDQVVLAVSGSGADTAAHVSSAGAAAAGRSLTVDSLRGSTGDGVERADGAWLVVVEAGDQLLPRALGVLAESLKASGSDVAVPGSTRRHRSTLGSSPDAAASTDLASVMMRRELWHEAELGLACDPAMPWLPAVRAVLAAKTLDLVPGPLRRGPRRGTGSAFSAMPGVAADLPRLVPRVTQLLDELEARGLRPARQHLGRWLLAEEATRYLRDAEGCDPEGWRLLVGLVRRLVDGRPPDASSGVDVERRVRAWLAAQDRRSDLEAFNLDRWQEEGEYPTRVDGHRVLAVLPVDDVPDEVLELTAEEASLVTRLRRARWSGARRLELELLAWTTRVGSSHGPAQVEVELVSASGRRLRLDVEQLHAPEVNQEAAEAQHDHSDGLLRTWVDLDRLPSDSTEDWSLRVGWDRTGVRRVAAVGDVERRGSVAALTPRDGWLLDPRSGVLRRGAGPARTEPAHPEVTSLELDGDVLLVAGTAQAGPMMLRVRGPRGTAAGTAEAADGRFRARLPLRHDPWQLGETPLPAGSYRLRLQGTADGGKGRLVLGESLAERTPYVERSADYRMRVERNPDGSAQLVLAPPLADDELGPFAQQALRRWYATDEHRLDPRLVYLQSYGGSGVTDSPAALHHELRRSRPDLRLVWAAADASVVVPAGAERVQHRSREWYETLARCGFVVTNTDMDEWFRKRPGQRLLQTFHGYPSKAMGIMAWEGKHFPPSFIDRRLRRTAGTWDLLLTPHPDMDVHYREQYRYDGAILSAGYPRDDELVGSEAERVRHDVRRRLGIGDRTAVLYAPTWRDDLTTNFRSAALPSTFDVERAAAALGEDYVLLLRGHRFHRQRPEVRGRLLDVTGYPEINHLVLAADAAVLDYSSLRFDVALTGRPMIFLVPDLDRYDSDVRGFLYDFRSSAPGPLLDSTEEVVDALRDLDGVSRRHRAEYERFNERFNALQDGHAAERVVTAFFG